MLLRLLVLLVCLLTIALLSVLLKLSLAVAILLVLAVLGVPSILLAVAVLAVCLARVECLRAGLESLGTGSECVAAAGALLEVQALLGLVGEVLVAHLVLPRVGGAVGHFRGWGREGFGGGIVRGSGGGDLVRGDVEAFIANHSEDVR